MISTDMNDSDLGPIVECEWVEDGDNEGDWAFMESLEGLANVETSAPVVVAESWEGIAIRQSIGADVVLQRGDRFVICAGSVARR